jgi:hypothetical protein
MHKMQKELTAHLLLLFAAPAGKFSVVRLLEALWPLCTHAQKLELQEAYKASKEKKVGPTSLGFEILCKTFTQNCPLHFLGFTTKKTFLDPIPTLETHHHLQAFEAYF